MNAPATAAQVAPKAAATAEKIPAWLTMTDEDFESYVKTAKIGTGSKRAQEMRDRRKEYAESQDDASVAGAAEEMAQGLAAAAAGAKKRTRLQVVAAAIALDKAPPDALRTRFVDPKMIDVREGWNARVDFGDLEELGQSILAQKRLDGHGLVNDVRVREKADGRYELIDGERRLQAVWGLIDRGEVWEFGIPAKVEPGASTDADLIIKMFTANAGKPFLPYEEALYYKRLRDSGLTIAQIEEKTGRSDNSIVGALALLEADDDLVDAVIKGQVSGGLAKSIAVNVRGNKEKQKELTQKAKAAKAAGDQKAMKSVKKEIDDERRAKAAKKMPNRQLKINALDKDDLAALGTKVGARLKALMEDKGMAFDTDLREWLAGDDELALAATFGALEALKAAAGVSADLDFGGAK